MASQPRSGLAKEPRESQRGEPEPDSLRHDERVKIDLPFATALRALLRVPPPEHEDGSANKRRKA